MNKHKMKSLINEARRKTPDATLHLLEKGLRKSRGITPEWAGEHKGRKRCVALLDAAIARAEVEAEAFQRARRARVVRKTAAEKKRRERSTTRVWSGTEVRLDVAAEAAKASSS